MKSYIIDVSRFTESQLNITRKCYLDLVNQVPNFLRHIYNTEFQFDGMRDYLFGEENLKKKFIDFCETQNISAEGISSLKRFPIFGNIFSESDFNVTKSNGFLRLKISKLELDLFERKNVAELKAKFENLDPSNVAESVNEVVNNGFTDKMIEFLKLEVQGQPSEQCLLFTSFLLRKIGLKLSLLFEKPLKEILISLKEKLPTQRSKLRFLMLDMFDLFNNDWLKRTESENDLDKEIVQAFVLSISRRPFTTKNTFEREFVKNKFSAFVSEHFLEPRHLDVSIFYSFTLLSSFLIQ